MQTLTLALCGLATWVAAHLLLSRVIFRSRLNPRPHERFEGQLNEGCQTTIVMLASGAVAVGVVLFLSLRS
jgi:hypothetical protein